MDDRWKMAWLDDLPTWLQLLAALALIAVLMVLLAHQQPGSAMYSMIAAAGGGAILGTLFGLVKCVYGWLKRRVDRG